MEFEKFTAYEVPLTKNTSNLVEASAGTGKTYSIAILVLRLILEEKIEISKILMVTFTRAAVAELQERIRKFIRLAYRHFKGEKMDDELIASLVDKTASDPNKNVERLLNSALLSLDEISVMTIHSFCQQTLNEFAFETGQLFNAELIPDDTEIRDSEIKSFWRKNITGLDKDLLFELKSAGLSLGRISVILKNHLDGKEFLFLDHNEDYELTEEKQEELIASINLTRENFRLSVERLVNYITDNKSTLIETCNSNKTAKNNILGYLDNPEEFVKEIEGRRGSAYIQNLFPDVLDLIDEKNKKRSDISKTIKEKLNYVLSYSIVEISKEITEFKNRNNLMTFEDMIIKLNQAVDGGKNKKLVNLLREKYEAVFIDEFQDTDKAQYEIFEGAFQGASILFYIGDPKQSIYAWRKADIYTYFRARANVDKVYTMNKNFRSTAEMVKAVNRFLLPNEDFDTFGYEGETDSIVYHEVDAKGKDEELRFNGKNVVPLTITRKKNQNDILYETGLFVLDLLTNPGYKFYNKKTKTERPVKTSDVGILVPMNAQAVNLKNELAKYNIPAVSMTDARILKSREAKDLSYLLRAINENTRANINRALLTGFFEYERELIQKFDEELLIGKFREYRNIWISNGIYAMMSAVATDFQIRERVLKSNSKSLERNVTNLFQLMELLFKTESRQKMNPSELIDWLEKNINLDSNAEDEWVQRIESDEEAVNIATIHKSKGLEYNIVVAPFLDMSPKTGKDKLISFRDTDENYKTAFYDELDEEKESLYLKGSIQENLRLLYVALTRSIYKCQVLSSTGKSDSVMNRFLSNIQYDDLIGEWSVEEVDKEAKYETDEIGERKDLRATAFSLFRSNWQRMSYSSLAGDMGWAPKVNFEKGGSYDEFIFKKLGKGARTGSYIHGIFEKLDFSNSESWSWVIQRETEGYKSINDSDFDEFKESVNEMLHQVLDTDIETDGSAFKLSEVSREKCIHELEFDFPVPEFLPKELNQILPDNRIMISDRYQSQIEGLMTGFVDLFFEHNGKYYVLDWKSNYLGPNAEDYSPENLDKAMTENNYHLQYMIYSLAVKKYLQSRLGDSFDFDRDFGGVYYLFLRGMREGTSNGVFYKKVSSAELMKLEELISVGV